MSRVTTAPSNNSTQANFINGHDISIKQSSLKCQQKESAAVSCGNGKTITTAHNPRWLGKKTLSLPRSVLAPTNCSVTDSPNKTITAINESKPIHKLPHVHQGVFMHPIGEILHETSNHNNNVGTMVLNQTAVQQRNQQRLEFVNLREKSATLTKVTPPYYSPPAYGSIPGNRTDTAQQTCKYPGLSSDGLENVNVKMLKELYQKQYKQQPKHHDQTIEMPESKIKTNISGISNAHDFEQNLKATSPKCSRSIVMSKWTKPLTKYEHENFHKSETPSGKSSQNYNKNYDNRNNMKKNNGNYESTDRKTEESLIVPVLPALRRKHNTLSHRDAQKSRPDESNANYTSLEQLNLNGVGGEDLYEYDNNELPLAVNIGNDWYYSSSSSSTTTATPITASTTSTLTSTMAVTNNQGSWRSDLHPDLYKQKPIQLKLKQNPLTRQLFGVIQEEVSITLLYDYKLISPSKLNIEIQSLLRLSI